MQHRLELLRGVIHPWHHDHFGHMNVRHYAPFFDDACYHMWTRLGVPYRDMQARYGVHTVSAQATTRFMKELRAGDLIVIDGGVGKIGTRSCTFELRMRHADTGDEHAIHEVVEVFFDPATRRSTAMPDPIRAQLNEWLIVR
ncbi:MAG: acyl-CoA thioesterase [Roseinatronobacter sp.]